MAVTRDELMSFIPDFTGEKAEYPFGEETAVFRHSDNRKWFAILMNIPREKLGLFGKGNIDIVNLKCDPLLTGSLFSEGGVFPAYHMNKEKWISVLLDGSLEPDKVKWLLEISFNLTARKIKKRK